MKNLDKAGFQQKIPTNMADVRGNFYSDVKRRSRSDYEGNADSLAKEQYLTRFGTDLALLADFGKRIDCDIDDAKFIVDQFVDAVREVLRRQSALSIRKLGMIYLRPKYRAKIRNPQTGVISIIPLIYRIRLVPSASLKSFINTKVKDNLRVMYDIGEGNIDKIINNKNKGKNEIP